MANRKLLRISSDIKKHVSQIITKLNSPVVQKNLVSVTSIKVASDLSFCKIYISVFGKSYDACKAFLAIQASSSYIRKELSNKLKLRHTPKLEFLKDKTLEQGAKIERMLQALMSLKK